MVLTALTMLISVMIVLKRRPTSEKRDYVTGSPRFYANSPCSYPAFKPMTSVPLPQQPTHMIVSANSMRGCHKLKPCKQTDLSHAIGTQPSIINPGKKQQSITINGQPVIY